MVLWQVVFDWMPLLILLVPVFFVFRINAKIRADLQRHREELMTEQRRHTEQLDRITRALEQRPSA